MTTISGAILDAISDGARTRSAIIEATGLEEKQVANNIYQLKSQGRINTDEGGYTIGASEAGHPPPAPRVHAIANGAESADDKKKVAKRAAAKAPKAKRAKAQKHTKVNGATHALPEGQPAAPRVATPDSAAAPVEFTYFGEFVVIRRKDVAELLKAVAIMDRWRVVVEAA